MFDTFLYAFNAVTPMLLLMLLGWGLKAAHFFDDNLLKRMNSFTFRFGISAMMFRNIGLQGIDPYTSGVQIMSIHRSKGLEFPVVLLTDLDKPFNRMDFQAPVLVHPQLGLGPMFIDLDRHIRYPTAAHRAVGERLSREMRSEEMRVLYVGMTRAKEKLIMTASLSSPEKKLADLTALSALPVPSETVASAKSMAEWILLPQAVSDFCAGRLTVRGAWVARKEKE